VLFSVLLLAMDHKSSQLEGVRALLSVVVHPIQSLVSLPLTVTDQTFQFFTSYNELKGENKKLKKEAFRNKTGLLKLNNLEKENIRLRAIMNKSFTLGESVLTAELIQATHYPYEHLILVDKGSPVGVKKQQPVLDVQGIIGQIIRVHPLSAEIMLITDPSHAVAVEISRNGLRTIAFGNGQYNQLKLPYLPKDADIKEGDLLISSGLGGIFPRGYPVAKISKIERDRGKSILSVLAKPVAELDKIRDVLIILNKAKKVKLTSSVEIKKPPL
jgi:rod shape-determining protein MreC